MSEQPKANDFKHTPGANDAEYIELLKRALERQKYLTSKAIAKLKKQPEIIRCGECKHYKIDHPKANGYHCCYRCHNIFPMKETDFCSKAERRTDK